MQKVLLDTNILDGIIRQDLKKADDLLNNKEVYISLGTLIELTSGGFNNRISEIDSFMKKYGVLVLTNVFPNKAEIENYPLKLDIKKYVGPKIGSINVLLSHQGYQKALDEASEIAKAFEKNVSEIRECIKRKSNSIDFNNKKAYRKFILEGIPKPKRFQALKLSNVPFNALIRAFTLEKFGLSNHQYQIQDFNDLLICFMSIYFDYFLVENKNYDILQKIIHKRRLKEIFSKDFKLMKYNDIK